MRLILLRAVSSDSRSRWCILAGALFTALVAPPAARGAGLPVASGGARILRLADNAFAGSSVNVVANVRQTLFTDGDLQYAAFYDGDGYMVLAKRRVDGDRWELRRTDYKANVADAHNAISLVVDGAGFLHVAWDHHNNPLTYARAVAPGSLELGAKSAMTGERERRVTYPQFFRMPNGDLLFLYRDGGSGNGALVLNRYLLAERRWVQVQPNLIDGEGARSPYWGMAVDRHGALHLTWTWRDTPDVASNHDLCYARSTDGGRTWTSSEGVRVAPPITAATAEYAVRIPQHRNLMNSPVVESDSDGQPYLMTYWSPEPGAPPQFQIVHRGAHTWVVTPVEHPLTPFVLAGGGTKRPPISRGILLLEDARPATARNGTSRQETVPTTEAGPAGGGNSAEHLRATVVYRDDSHDGRILAVASTPGMRGPWHVTELTTTGVDAWEPAHDPAAWQDRGTLQLLVEVVRQRDGNDRSAAVVAPAPIGVLAWKPDGR